MIEKSNRTIILLNYNIFLNSCFNLSIKRCHHDLHSSTVIHNDSCESSNIHSVRFGKLSKINSVSSVIPRTPYTEPSTIAVSCKCICCSMKAYNINLQSKSVLHIQIDTYSLKCTVVDKVILILNATSHEGFNARVWCQCPTNVSYHLYRMYHNHVLVAKGV